MIERRLVRPASISKRRRRRKRRCVGSVGILEIPRIRCGIRVPVAEVSSLFIRIASFSGSITVTLVNARFFFYFFFFNLKFINVSFFFKKNSFVGDRKLGETYVTFEGINDI